MVNTDIRLSDDEKIQTVIRKNDLEIILNDEETKDLWKKLSYAECFDFKIPF